MEAKQTSAQDYSIIGCFINAFIISIIIIIILESRNARELFECFDLYLFSVLLFQVMMLIDVLRPLSCAW